MHRYTVILEYDAEAGGYGAIVPALPGCASMGDTVEAALANVREAIALHVAALEADGEAVPEDRAVLVTTVAA